jgi:acetyl-CoA carboxylase carboxyl transferase subunit beta
MLGDINVAEPNALVAFAGPRVVKDTTGKDLPEGFQRSEFVLEHGFLDKIIERKNLKKQINLYIDLVQNLPVRK